MRRVLRICVIMQGDACSLPEAYTGTFDAVLAANLLDRVPDPLRVLQQVRGNLCQASTGLT